MTVESLSLGDSLSSVCGLHGHFPDITVSCDGCVICILKQKKLTREELSLSKQDLSQVSFLRLPLQLLSLNCVLVTQINCAETRSSSWICVLVTIKHDGLSMYYEQVVVPILFELMYSANILYNVCLLFTRGGKTLYVQFMQ